MRRRDIAKSPSEAVGDDGGRAHANVATAPHSRPTIDINPPPRVPLVWLVPRSRNDSLSPKSLSTIQPPVVVCPSAVVVVAINNNCRTSAWVRTFRLRIYSRYKKGYKSCECLYRSLTRTGPHRFDIFIIARVVKPFFYWGKSIYSIYIYLYYINVP